MGKKNNNDFVIRYAQEIDCPAISQLLRNRLPIQQAGLSEDEKQQLAEFIRADRIQERVQAGACILLIQVGAETVGCLELRIYRHIALMAVAAEYAGQGLGRSLVEAAQKQCRRQNPKLEGISVQAAPGAVDFYLHLGFIRRQDGPEKHRPVLYKTLPPSD